MTPTNRHFPACIRHQVALPRTGLITRRAITRQQRDHLAQIMGMCSSGRHRSEAAMLRTMATSAFKAANTSYAFRDKQRHLALTWTQQASSATERAVRTGWRLP